MISCNRGDVVLVPFPFSDQSSSKKRPAIVISSIAHNATSRDIVIMAVSSQTQRPVSVFEFLINNWQEAGLLKPSAAKAAISTIDSSLVIRRLGALSPNDMGLLDASIKGLLGIA